MTFGLQAFVSLSSAARTEGLEGLIWWVGLPMEPSSLAGFLVLDAPPKLLFVGAFGLLVAEVTRNRLAVIFCGLSVVLGQVFWASSLPLFLSDPVALVSRYGISDLLPSYSESAGGLLKPFGYAGLGTGLVFCAVAVRHGERGASGYAWAGGVLAVVGTLGIGGVALGHIVDMNVREHWLGQQRLAGSAPLADVEHVRASVELDPGDGISVDATMRVRVPGDVELKALLFSLNPAFELGDVTLDGESVDFEFEAGLLTIGSPETVTPGSTVLVGIQASGLPDERFAYVDDERDWRWNTRSSPLLLLGTRSSIVDHEYVALMPGVRWLPMAGPNLASTPTDYFALDMIVVVPPGWLVAGPGKRQALGEGRFRFTSRASVPHAAIFAAPFARSSVVVRDVEFEVLMSPRHASRAASFVDVVHGRYGLVDAIEELLDRAARYGLPYPYEGLSLVEVPASLRTYGGGWRKDTEAVQPGILMMQEYGFPMYRTDRAPARSGGDSRPTSMRLSALTSRFTFNLQGGNYQQLARNLFHFLASADGKSAAALDQLCLELVIDVMWPGRRVIDGKVVSLGSFAAHPWASNSGGIGIGPLFENLTLGRLPHQLVVTNDVPSNWDRMERVGLVDLPTADEDQGVGVFLLRTKAMREAIFARLGVERVGAVLADLRNRFAGGAFDGNVFANALAEHDRELGELIRAWLDGTQLPRFAFSDVALSSVNADDGGIKHHLSVHVRNDGLMRGAFRLMYDQTVDGLDWQWRDSELVIVAGGEGVEIGLVLAELPQEVWLEPFLALNRRPTRLGVRPARGPEEAGEFFVGRRPSSWQPPQSRDVLVDDLDQGFSVDDGGGGASLPWHRKGRFLSGWSREEQPTSWGRYLRTTARLRGRGGATFLTELSEGDWRLAFHVPDVGAKSWGYWSSTSRDVHGTYRFEIRAGDFSEDIKVERADVAYGWNDLGRYRFRDGPVSVRLYNADDRGESTIYADAVRWSHRGSGTAQ